MSLFPWIVAGAAVIGILFLQLRKQKVEAELVRVRDDAARERERLAQSVSSAEAAARASIESKIAELAAEAQRIKRNVEEELARVRDNAARERERLEHSVSSTKAAARASFESKIAELAAEAQRIREHYEAEARKSVEALHSELVQARAELEPLRSLAALQKSEEEVRSVLAGALEEAEQLRKEAQASLERARAAASEERRKESQRAQEAYQQAEAMLKQATRDASQIIAKAYAEAHRVGGDAYAALREKEALEMAVKAIHNVIEGYGDRYIIPTHSVLDELASDFGHTAAGESLRVARDRSREMVAEGLAAACDYVETTRRETAIRFVTDAFNGRVDAILTRAKHDNIGTLQQEIRDTWALVNLNGEAFRSARILPNYCDARMEELRWAVAVQELKLKEREEQRRIKEQSREEEKARRDYERAVEEAAKEEEAIRRAMEKAQASVAQASERDREKFEAQLAELNEKLAAAEKKNQRAMSMAQQTRSGHVYIISNVGSFGEDMLKIGMTRRLDPEDRIKELSDASVPFSFDVHAMIRCDDAPALERLLHERFGELRVNKVNYRKEFFSVPIQRLREFAAENKLEVAFTMTAEAREYRETLAFEKMSPEEQRRYHMRELDEDAFDG